MNEDDEVKGSIFDAIDAVGDSSDEEFSETLGQDGSFSDAGEMVTDDVSDFSDGLETEPVLEAEGTKPSESSYAAFESNENEEEIKPFQKMSAKTAMDNNGSRKPPVLNKKFILYCIIGVFSFIVIFALFIFPEVSKVRKKNNDSRNVAMENSVTDYSKLVGENKNKSAGNREDSGRQAENKPEQSETTEEIIENLPPVNDNYTYKEPVRQDTYYGSSSMPSYEVPDTRTDALQAKSINGIKGISSTQKNYLTPDNSGTGFNNPAAAQTDGSATSSNPYAKFGVPDQATYTNQLLSQYAGNNNSYALQNDQSGKNNFYNQNRGSVSGQWLPLNTIWQGTIFDATLTSEISTDLPGECTAVITKNIYSSQDGRYLLIPQNSKLLGSYNSSISYSQSRVQVGWHTLIRPDGYMVNLGNFNATDTKGASGLKGLINDHPFAYLKAIALMSAVNIVNSELQTTSASSSNQYVQNVMANSQEVATKLGEKLIERAMDVQPTVKIKAGTIINIVANTNLELPVLEPWEVTEAYHKTK